MRGKKRKRGSKETGGKEEGKSTFLSRMDSMVYLETIEIMKELG